MPKNNENFNKELEGFLRAQGIKKIATLDTSGEAVPDSKHADQFKFHYRNGDFDYGTVTITTNDGKVTVYFNESVVRDPERGIDTNWTKFLMKLKDWSLRNGQMGFQVRNLDELGNQMRKRQVQKEEENLLEGYYGTKHTSYNDNNPKIKMIIKHNKALDEHDQRFRYIDKIFLENEVGERLLVPTKKPSVGRAFARHLAEGGEYNDDRWKHIYEISEDLSKLSGFVRATKTNQFNESVMQIVNEATEHYLKLKETLHKIQGSRGYHQYFESYKPAIMENDVEHDYGSMFMSNRLDPRIENAFSVLNKLNIRSNELSEANEFEEWANSIVEGRSPELDKKIDDLLKILNNSEKVAVGADAMNIKGQLDDIIDDDNDKDQLYAELEKVAHADPDHDAKPVITAWLQEHSDDKFYGDVLDKMETSTPTPPEAEPEIATNPSQGKAKKPEQSMPSGGNKDIPEPSPEDAKAAQQFMPQPLAEKSKKPVQRNFVAKHAQRSGAGSHGKKGFQRHDKHKKKLGEEGVAEGSATQKTFEIVYYSPKTDRNVTKTITAGSESEVWDRLKQKGIDVISVKEQGVKEDQLDELKCWDGYKRVPGTTAGAPGSCEEINEIFNPTSGVSSFLRSASNFISDYVPVLLGAGGTFIATSAVLGPVAAALASSTVGTQIFQTIQNQQGKVPGLVQQFIEKYVGSEQEAKEFMLLHAKNAYLEKPEFRWRGKNWPVTLKKDQAEAIVEKFDQSWLDQQKEKELPPQKEKVENNPLTEFATNSGGDDILKTLASNWYHGDAASGDLHSDIQSQEQVERRLEKGVVCPDGVKRKLYIDYSDDYEGVTVYSDDDWSITYKHDELSESNTNESLKDIKRLSGLK